MRAVTGQLDRLEAKVATLQRVPLVAVVLDLPACPSWAEALDGSRCVRIIGGEKAARRRTLARLRKDPEGALEGVIRLEHRPGASAFIGLAVTGPAREVACIGARGDRKTSAVLAAMLIHADLHREAGHALPVRWMGVTGTFQSHAMKTCRTLEAAWWGGVWRLRDGGRLAVAVIDGVELVHLDLFGIEDQGANDKARSEAHGVWLEEPAPAAVLEASSGVSEDTWAIALTSLRLPSHHRPALITSNLPDEDFWMWARFVTRQHPGTAYVRIRPGESASEADRQAWAEALANRPDLLRRLLHGQPGVIAQGPQVAVGYNEDCHVVRGQRLAIDRYTPLLIGQDGGHFPSSVIGQRVKGELRVFAGLVTEHAGMRQHVEQTLLPWLSHWAPWVLAGRGNELLAGHFDPSLDTGDQSDIEQNPRKVLERLVGGYWRPGAVSWAGRRDPMLAVFNMASAGRAALQIAEVPETEELRKALSGRWYYAPSPGGGVQPQPRKPNGPYADLGDAFCYLAGGLTPGSVPDTQPVQRYAKVQRDVYSRPGESLDEPRRATTTFLNYR